MSSKKKQDSGKISYIFTKETMGMTLMLFSGIVLIMLFTRDKVFSGLGTAICDFMYGIFGYGSILMFCYLAYLGLRLTFDYKIKIKRSFFITLTAAIFILFLLFHAVTTRNIPLNGFTNYLAACSESAQNGWSGYTFGGASCGVLVYPVAKLTTFIGAYVIFSVLFCLCGYIVFFLIRRNMPEKAAAETKSEQSEEVTANSGVSEQPIPSGENAYAQTYAAPTNYYEQNNPYNPAPQQFAYQQPQNYPYQQPVEQPNTSYQQPANQPQSYQVGSSGQSGYSASNVAYAPPAQSEQKDDKYSRENLGRKIIFGRGEFDAESYKRNMIYSGESYFNHPANGVESYLSNFKTSSDSGSSSQTDTLPASGSGSGNSVSYPSSRASAVSENAQHDSFPDISHSYTENYQDEVEHKTPDEAPSNYVYGEKPVEILDDGFDNEIKPQESQNSESFDSDRPVRESESSFDRLIEIKAEPERRIFERPREINSEPVQPETGRIADFRRDGDKTQNSRDSVSPLFGNDSHIENTDRAERTGRDKDIGRDDRKDSKINLFDDDNDESADKSDSIFGLPSRGDHPDRSLGSNEIPDRGEIRGERRSGDRFSDSDSGSLRGGREIGFGAPTSDRWGRAESKRDDPKEEPPKERPKHVWKKYVRPSLDLLNDYPENNSVNTGEIEDNKRIIVETLEKFKIESQVSNVIVGPAITRYDVIIPDRTNIKRSLSYRDEIALALMKDNVNAYLNYSKGAISIEIPNNKRAVVGLKSMLASPQFINSKQNSLTFGLGKNVEGTVVCPDITKMPHLLVAGTTGSGKSICLNALLVSLLYKYGPEELRLILVDPKQSEFITFRRLPHLMINEILYDVDKVIKALNWAIKEMERRYTLFKEMTERGVATRNLDEYNFNLPEGEEKLPKILIVLDEFGDLMMQAKKDIEMRIIRLAQKARACGLHLILATQRPSVDCITGLIKSNLPSRIGFKVNSFDDSRTIFDVGGAEKLLGMGDMYFRSAEKPELTRIQGCFVDSQEVQKVTNFVRDNNETFFDQDATDFINKVDEPEATAASVGEDGEDSGDGKMDETYLKALKYCIVSNQASVSMIQRRFPVGYIKACKIIDWMDKMNYVTKSEGSKPRKVLMTMDDFVNTYGEIDD